VQQEEFRIMTADPATYPAIPATFVAGGASPRRTDPVRARVSGGHALTNSPTLYTGHENGSEAHTTHRGLHLLADTRGAGPRGPHPGDVLYWVACLGGACLLLLSATT
jgi:hypothetical protein